MPHTTLHMLNDTWYWSTKRNESKISNWINELPKVKLWHQITWLLPNKIKKNEKKTQNLAAVPLNNFYGEGLVSSHKLQAAWYTERGCSICPKQQKLLCTQLTTPNTYLTMSFFLFIVKVDSSRVQCCAPVKFPPST